MISRGFLKLAFAALSALAVGGCSSADMRGTRGQLGTLRFEYSAEGVCSGCAIDREVLAGSLLEIDLHGVHPRIHYDVRSTDPDVADFQLTARCRFAGEEGCHDGVALIAKGAGDADLEIFDAWTETVLDRVTIKVREAASLETVVRATESDGTETELLPTPSGVFEVAVDTNVAIMTTARSESGAELIATSAAIQSAYADEQVVGPRGETLGVSPTELAKAKSPGTATVAIAGGGARQELRFHVVE